MRGRAERLFQLIDEVEKSKSLRKLMSAIDSSLDFKAVCHYLASPYPSGCIFQFNRIAFSGFPNRVDLRVPTFLAHLEELKFHYGASANALSRQFLGSCHQSDPGEKGASSNREVSVYKRIIARTALNCFSREELSSCLGVEAMTLPKCKGLMIWVSHSTNKTYCYYDNSLLHNVECPSLLKLFPRTKVDFLVKGDMDLNDRTEASIVLTSAFTMDRKPHPKKDRILAKFGGM